MAPQAPGIRLGVRGGDDGIRADNYALVRSAAPFSDTAPRGLRCQSTNMQGVTSSVRPVAKARPPAMALESCVHHWVEGAPSPRPGPSRSMLIPSTIGMKIGRAHV